MPDETRKTTPEIVFADAPGGVLRTYSNHINVTWNAFDVRLSFGDTGVNPNKEGKILVETKAVITVSWVEAKQILDVMQVAIKRFEADNGEIKRVTDIKIS